MAPGAIANVAVDGAALVVTFEGDVAARYPALWLRDHATDAASFDARSNQRITDTAALDPAIRPVRCERLDSGDVAVQWPDLKEPSVYAADFLRRFSDASNSRSAESTAVPWRSVDESDIRLDFSQLGHPDGHGRLLDRLQQTGFALIANCPRETASVKRVADLMGYVRETIYGGIWTFGANEAMADSAYTDEALRPHTDGTYNHDAPGLQLLLCIEYEAEGGASILVDGASIFERLPQHQRDVLSQVAVPGQYVGDGVSLLAERPVFRLGQEGNLLQVSFNNYDRAPFRLDDEVMAAFYDAHRAFEKLANDPANQWCHVLAPGEMIIFDNWRLLHGRESFRGRREMAGCYVNREDFESSLRRENATRGTA